MTQLIPARGRKPCIPASPLSPRGRHNLSPRGDGNEYCPNCNRSVPRTQLIPARGRKLTSPLISATSPWTQLIPARGRKRYLIGQIIKATGRHNLSPRGDGNRFHLRPIALIRRGHNLSPRGDGNYGALDVLRIPGDTTYPREGTETAPKIVPLPHLSGHNLSPRGDGNYGNPVNPPGRQDTTYPREGTETAVRFTNSNTAERTQLIPARGRKQIISVLPDIK